MPPVHFDSIYKRPVELLQNLIRFDTTNPPGNEAECVSYINDLLSGAGFETMLLAKESNRPNLLTRLKGQGNAPPLMMYGHVDVVTTANQEWTHPPFKAEIEDGFVWGRGALDMKSGISMMLAALIRAKAEALAPRGDIILAILSDEEAVSECGADYLVNQHPELFKGVRYAISEFGGQCAHIAKKKFYTIQVAEKQICWMRATVSGPGGHGARPLRGGAMSKLADFLHRLDRLRLPVHVTPVLRQMVETIASNLAFPKGMILRQMLKPALSHSVLKTLGHNAENFESLLHNTVNATIVRGGDKMNVIPSEVTIDLDGRLLPGFSPEDMMKELHHIIGHEVQLELLRYEPGPAEPEMGIYSTLAGILRDADPEGIAMPLMIPGITDARIFSRLGIQTYGFTPMNLPEDFDFFKTLHAADERIPVAAVDFGTNAIYELLKRYGSETPA